MPEYDLKRLGDRAFQQLVIALSRGILGPGVEAFGDGRDGGRDATFTGQVNWSKTVLTDPGNWDGYTVIQVKHRRASEGKPAVWLQGEIRREIERWIRAAKDSTRKKLPDYLIFATNVELSAVAEVGGIDKINAFVRDQFKKGRPAADAGLRVRDFKIWHADQIRTMLDADQATRWAFPGLLTPGDVLAQLGGDNTRLGSMDLSDPVRHEVVQSLAAERWVRLSQAGGPGDAKLDLHDIVIDMPGTLISADGAEQVGAIRHILTLGDLNLSQKLEPPITKPHIVVVGGPGQGKSTLTQFLAQTYRVAMLQGQEIAPTANGIAEGIRDAHERLGLHLPANRRWPVRLDLSKYAEELATQSDVSLLRWMSDQISARTETSLSPQQLQSWLAAWPWALLLDGLDEVPSASTRQMIYQRVETFLAFADDLDADLLIVMTTRPTGYDDRAPTPEFDHLRLEALSAQSAASFSQSLTDKRFDDDPEMRATVASRMRDAAQNPAVARLMQSPLQVTIMSFIVEKHPTLPVSRFFLFDLYYSTVLEREISKGISISRFLSENRQRVDRLHEQVGLRLQIAAESAGGADAVLGLEELTSIARDLLVSGGYEQEKAKELADQLLEAATLRLVLLVPREHGIGFEVRTLQELMAARALTQADDTTAIAALSITAHSPHWRNTWLLAAGVLLARHERFESLLAELLRKVDPQRGVLLARWPSSPALAADLLEDGLDAGRPNFRKLLIRQVLTALDHGVSPDASRIARALLRLADEGDRTEVLERLAGAKTSGLRGRAVSAVILGEMLRSGPHHSRATQVINALDALALSPAEAAAVEAWLSGPASPKRGSADTGTIAAAFLAELAAPLLGEHEVAPMTQLVNLLGSTRFVVDPVDGVAQLTTSDLSSPTDGAAGHVASEDLAVSLDLALGSVTDTHWVLAAAFGRALVPACNRSPQGPVLLGGVAVDRQ